MFFIQSFSALFSILRLHKNLKVQYRAQGYFGMETEATSDQGQYMTATHQKKGVGLKILCKNKVTWWERWFLSNRLKRK